MRPSGWRPTRPSPRTAPRSSDRAATGSRPEPRSRDAIGVDVIVDMGSLLRFGLRAVMARGHRALSAGIGDSRNGPRYLASGPGTWPDRVEGSSPLLYGPRGRPASPSAIGSNFADIAPDRSGPGTGAGLDDLSRRRLPPVPPRRISRRCRGPGPDGLDRWAYRPDADRGPAGTGPQRQSVRNGRGDAAPPGRARLIRPVWDGAIHPREARRHRDDDAGADVRAGWR